MEEQAKILIVDDEVNVLNSLMRVLRIDGYDVTAVDSPKKALEKLEGKNFNVVISDLKMPNMDGIEFLSLAAELYPKTIQILLSGNANSDDVLKAMKYCEIVEFVAKPWNSDDLRSLIAELVEQQAA